MESFQEFLEAKREEFEGESDRVAIAEAGVEYSKVRQLSVDERFSKRDSSGAEKFDKVSSAVRSVPDQLRGDIENLEDGSYSDLVRFMRKYERFVNEVQGGRLYNPLEKEYIEQTVEPVINEIAKLQGPVARSAFALEDFVSQFKPLKLADRFLGDLPIIGGMIRERIQAKQEADRLARSVGLRAKKEDTRGELKAAAQNKPAQSAGDLAFDTGETGESSDSPTSKIGKKASKMMKGVVSEESQKEQANLRQKELNIFETIKDNTERTNELLEELTEATEDLDSPGGGILEALGLTQLFKGGKGIVGKVGTAAAGAFGLTSMFGKNKAPPVDTPMKKGAGKAAGKVAGKTALKAVIKKIPIIGLGAGLLFGAERLMRGDVTGAGMEVVSGAAGMVPGPGTALSVATDAALAAKDINKANKEIDNTIEQATTEAISESKNVGLDQVYQINADQVMLKANSMKQLQDQNDTMKTAMSSGQGGTQNNSVVNQVTNTAKSQFLGPRLGSTNPRNVAKSIF